jgi:hypothetical protein
VLESSTVKSSYEVVAPLADDFATAYDDASIVVVERGESGLLAEKRQVVVGLHYVRSLVFVEFSRKYLEEWMFLFASWHLV